MLSLDKIKQKQSVPALKNGEKKELFELLHYLNMGELKKLCSFYGLPVVNKKEQLITFIYSFIDGKKIELPQPIPAQSKASRGMHPVLAPESLMLKGAYKNDAKTRAFFKKLIGNHFHFTAFGIDWLNERWQQGNPPTYREFALFWQQEQERRKKEPARPKPEWALLNFIQRYNKSHPKATREEVMKAWHVERSNQVNRVREILNIDVQFFS